MYSAESVKDLLQLYSMEDYWYSLEDLIRLYTSYGAPLSTCVDIDFLLHKYTLFLNTPKSDRPVSGMLDTQGFQRFDEMYGLDIFDGVVDLCVEYYYLSQVQAYELMGFMEPFMVFDGFEEVDDEDTDDDSVEDE